MSKEARAIRIRESTEAGPTGVLEGAVSTTGAELSVTGFSVFFVRVATLWRGFLGDDFFEVGDSLVNWIVLYD